MVMSVTTVEVSERHSHYNQRFWRAEIETSLATHGPRLPQLAWPILAAQRRS
jgi:hypothetical protein